MYISDLWDEGEYFIRERQSCCGLSIRAGNLLKLMLNADYLFKTNKVEILKNDTIIHSDNGKLFHALKRRELLEFQGFRHYKLSEKGKELAEKLQKRSGSLIY